MAIMTGVKETSTLESDRIASVRDAIKRALAEVNIHLPGVDVDFSDTESREDPFDGSVTLFCYWRDRHNNLQGSIQLHDSGRIFAEYDVLKNHPKKIGWFIESVSVWGDEDKLQSELQLLKLPE